MSDFVRVPETDWRNILDAVRGKTGGADKMVSGVVAAAIAGIATGGGGTGAGLAYDMGEFVLDADINTRIDGIPHSLGAVPSFVLIWTDDFSDLSPDNLSQYPDDTSLGYAWFDGLMGMTQRLTSVASSDYGVFIGFRLAINDYRLSPFVPASAAYTLDAKKLPSAEKFSLVGLGGNTQKWRAGVTYKYFVSKAWWNVGGAANAE